MGGHRAQTVLVALRLALPEAKACWPWWRCACLPAMVGADNCGVVRARPSLCLVGGLVHQAGGQRPASANCPNSVA